MREFPDGMNNCMFGPR